MAKNRNPLQINEQVIRWSLFSVLCFTAPALYFVLFAVQLLPPFFALHACCEILTISFGAFELLIVGVLIGETALYVFIFYKLSTWVAVRLSRFTFVWFRYILLLSMSAFFIGISLFPIYIGGSAAGRGPSENITDLVNKIYPF